MHEPHVELGGSHTQLGSSHGHGKPTSPVRKLLNLFTGICKTQRDIQVVQRQEVLERRKNTDSLKMITEHKGLTPRSPIAEHEPLEEIESLEDRLADFGAAKYYQQYFDPQSGVYVGSSSEFQPPPPPPPPPGEGVFGAHPGGYFYTAVPPQPPPAASFVEQAMASIFTPPSGESLQSYHVSYATKSVLSYAL